MEGQITPLKHYCAACGTVDGGMGYCLACGSTSFVEHPPERIQRPAGVTILGVLQILGGAVSLLLSSVLTAALSLTPFGFLSLVFVAVLGNLTNPIKPPSI